MIHSHSILAFFYSSTPDCLKSGSSSASYFAFYAYMYRNIMGISTESGRSHHIYDQIVSLHEGCQYEVVF